MACTRRKVRTYINTAAGTDRGHAVSIARGSLPVGPFAWHPGNPILSARSTDSPVQNLGHADLVVAPDGSHFMVMLGVRPVGLALAFSPLGRETFITTVDWVDGWPQPEMVQLTPSGGTIDLTFTFSGPDDLNDPGWVGVRTVPSAIGSLTARPGWLTIRVTDKICKRRGHVLLAGGNNT